MESTRKHRGFMGGKLLKSLFRASKPTSSSVQFSGSRVKPTQPSSSNEDFPTNIPAPKQRIQFREPDSITVRESINYGRISNLYHGGGDKDVDIKAENYISCVKERFRNEHEDMVWRSNIHESGSQSHTRMPLLGPLVDANSS